jgi:glycogen operon protein
MPVFQFDEQDAPDGLKNYWGYAPVRSSLLTQATVNERIRSVRSTSFVRWSRLCTEPASRSFWMWCSTTRLRAMRLDQHSAFRGLDNEVYYLLENDRSRYSDYTGTGNTLNTNRSIVRRMILDSLRYWVEEMHVDGFASIWHQSCRVMRRALRCWIHPSFGT